VIGDAKISGKCQRN